MLGKKLDTRIIFPDPQECACSEKIEKAMVERCKFSFDLNSNDFEFNLAILLIAYTLSVIYRLI